MAGMRRHGAALTRVLLERFVKRRCIKQRKALDLKDRVVCNHTVVRDDIEGRRGQAPPRSGDFAIRYEAFMQHITVFFTFCPFPLEIKGVTGRQEAGSRDDLGGRNAVYIVEDSGFGSDVILAVIAVDLVALDEILEVNMPSSLRLASVFVVVDLVRQELFFSGLEMRMPAHMADRSLRFLLVGDGQNIVQSGSIRPLDAEPLIWIRSVRSAGGLAQLGRSPDEGRPGLSPSGKAYTGHLNYTTLLPTQLKYLP